MELLFLTVGGLVVGTALGWYLRPLIAWCPACGWRLICDHCGYCPATGRRNRHDAVTGRQGRSVSKEHGNG